MLSYDTNAAILHSPKIITFQSQRDLSADISTLMNYYTTHYEKNELDLTMDDITIQRFKLMAKKIAELPKFIGQVGKSHVSNEKLICAIKLDGLKTKLGSLLTIGQKSLKQEKPMEQDEKEKAKRNVNLERAVEWIEHYHNVEHVPQWEKQDFYERLIFERLSKISSTGLDYVLTELENENVIPENSVNRQARKNNKLIRLQTVLAEVHKLELPFKITREKARFTGIAQTFMDRAIEINNIQIMDNKNQKLTEFLTEFRDDGNKYTIPILDRIALQYDLTFSANESRELKVMKIISFLKQKFGLPDDFLNKITIGGEMSGQKRTRMDETIDEQDIKRNKVTSEQPEIIENDISLRDDQIDLQMNEELDNTKTPRENDQSAREILDSDLTDDIGNNVDRIDEDDDDDGMDRNEEDEDTDSDDDDDEIDENENVDEVENNIDRINEDDDDDGMDRNDEDGNNNENVDEGNIPPPTREEINDRDRMVSDEPTLRDNNDEPNAVPQTNDEKDTGPLLQKVPLLIENDIIFDGRIDSNSGALIKQIIDSVLLHDLPDLNKRFSVDELRKLCNYQNIHYVDYNEKNEAIVYTEKILGSKLKPVPFCSEQFCHELVLSHTNIDLITGQTCLEGKQLDHSHYICETRLQLDRNYCDRTHTPTTECVFTQYEKTNEIIYFNHDTAIFNQKINQLSQNLAEKEIDLTINGTEYTLQPKSRAFLTVKKQELKFFLSSKEIALEFDKPDTIVGQVRQILATIPQLELIANVALGVGSIAGLYSLMQLFAFIFRKMQEIFSGNPNPRVRRGTVRAVYELGTRGLRRIDNTEN